jgi:hypothetical protein
MYYVRYDRSLNCLRGQVQNANILIFNKKSKKNYERWLLCLLYRNDFKYFQRQSFRQRQERNTKERERRLKRSVGHLVKNHPFIPFYATQTN